MEWIYVAIIIFTMVYSGGIVVEYTNRALEIRPKIPRLLDRALELTDEAETELRARDGARAHVEELRAEILEAQHDIDLARRRIQTEDMRRRRLEMVLMRNRLRVHRICVN